MAGCSSIRLDGCTRRINENAAPNTKNKTFSVMAEVVVPNGGAADCRDKFLIPR
jgi:hypothetical protein